MNLLLASRCMLLYAIPVLILIDQGADGVEYGAAVVEYHYTPDLTSPEQTLINNVNQYVQIIHQFKQRLTTQLNVEKGIIVFPECGLTPQLNVSEIYVQVPEPSYQYPNLTGNKVVSDLSQAAKETGLYVVVNLLEACGNKRYNTEVVFRSDGTIAARYRKFNLYGEAMDRTPTAELVSFTTDFNVTFGVFICFDILYQHPPLDLIKQGIKHFVFSSEWYSELPFLTAVQYQMSWSWMNDVTLLASGLGNTDTGSTGSGIYLGRQGPLVYYQANITVGSILVSALLDSSNPGTGNSPTVILLNQLRTNNLQPKQSDVYTLQHSKQASDDNNEAEGTWGETESLDQTISDESRASHHHYLKCKVISFSKIVSSTEHSPTSCKVRSTTWSDIADETIVAVISTVDEESNKDDAVGQGLQLKHEPLTEYTTELIGPEGCESQGNISGLIPGQLVNCTRRIKRQLCNRGLCCSFDLTSVFTICKHPCYHVPRLISDDFSLSPHRMAVFNGVRSFDVTTGGIQTCGIVSCSNGSVSSCGYTPTILELDMPHKILYRYITRLKIEGLFDQKDAFISPNILLGHFQSNDWALPTFGVLTNNFTMNVNEVGYAVLEYESDIPHPLGTVAIFSRLFNRDGQQVSGAFRPITSLYLHLYPLLFLHLAITFLKRF